MVIKVPFVQSGRKQEGAGLDLVFASGARINNCGLSAFNERKLLLHDLQNGEYPHWNTANDFHGGGNRVMAQNTKLGSDALGPWVSTEAHCAICVRSRFRREHGVRSASE